MSAAVHLLVAYGYNEEAVEVAMADADIMTE